MTAPAVGDQATAQWADQRPAACSGSAVITPTAANTSTTLAVSFPAGRFTSPPIVVVGLSGSVSASTGVVVWAQGVATSGFTLGVSRGNTTATGLTWIAIDPNY